MGLEGFLFYIYTSTACIMVLSWCAKKKKRQQTPHNGASRLLLSDIYMVQ